MYRYFLLPFLFISACQAADTDFSSTSYERHKEHVQYFNESSGKVQESFWDRKFFTGDWGGVRQSMSESGVTLTSTIVSDLLGNPVGGIRRGFREATSWGADITLDLEKIAKMPGMLLYSSIAYRFGNNLSADCIGNQFNVAQVFGGETFHFVCLYIQQKLFYDKVMIRLGRLSLGDTFLQSPVYSFFVSNGINGNPVSIFYNTSSFVSYHRSITTAYPFATWGAYIDINPIHWLDIKFGVYNANGNISENKYHGLNFTFDNTDGVQYITEWNFKLNQGPSSTGMPGNYKIGYYYVTGDVQEFLDGKHQGNQGYYFLFDQMVYREGGAGSDQGLTPFIALLFSPKKYAEFPFFGVIGATYKGLIPGRDKDHTSIDMIYGQYSADLRELQRLGTSERWGNQPQHYEIVLEATHWFQLNQWLYIMPDLQYIINPGGTGNIKNAVVLGAQVGLTF